MSFVSTQPEALIAAQYSAHAQIYQALSAQSAAAWVFVNTLATSAGSYAATEAANATVAG